MGKNIIKFLKDIGEEDFRLLELHLQSANMCRDIQMRYQITDEHMASELGLTKVKFKHFRNGGFEYSLRDWAKLQAIQTRRETERMKIKVEAKIQFSEYKDSKSPTTTNE